MHGQVDGATTLGSDDLFALIFEIKEVQQGTISAAMPIGADEQIPHCANSVDLNPCTELLILLLVVGCSIRSCSSSLWCQSAWLLALVEQSDTSILTPHKPSQIAHVNLERKTCQYARYRIETLYCTILKHIMHGSWALSVAQNECLPHALFRSGVLGQSVQPFLASPK